ncbi:MAG: 4-hydroxy-tetrahydrodipicolinate synthase [Coprobacillaceae bacterium]
MKEVYTALITPFDEEGAIDYESLKKLMDHLISQGNTRFLICGTTAEVSTLRLHEKKQLVRYVRYHYPDIQIIVGSGSNSTNEVIRQMQELSNIQGIDAFMVVTPYYNKPSQEGLYQHYSKIAKATDKNIIIYNVPSRTACEISNHTVSRLIKKYKNIIGLKQAGEIAGIRKLKDTFPDFKIYVGNDNLLKEALELGADGIISVVSHVDYPLIENICNTEDHFQDAYLKILSKYLFMESSPAPTKYVLSKMGYIKNKLRLPLVPVSKSLEKQLDSIVEKYK